MSWHEKDSSLADDFRVAAGLRSPTRAELAAALGRDRAELDALLASWADLGLATVEGERVQLRSPEAAIARRVATWGARIRDDSAGLERMLEAIGPLQAAWRDSFTRDAADYTIDRIDRDEGAWFAWWSYLLDQGRRRTLAIVSNLDAIGRIDVAAPGHLAQLASRLRAGEISLELIVPPEARTGPASRLVSALVEAGAAVRVGDTAGWFAVTPGRAALVPAVWDRDRDVDALVLHVPSIVAGLEQLFRMRWETAEPWAAGAADPVIELLCLGLADAAIAARLGISVRSVRRRVAAAITASGAATRMELGYRLGRAAGRPA